jgi:hypothetical protein
MKNPIQLIVIMFNILNLLMLSTLVFAEDNQNQPLGTLFTDPQLRQQLEFERKNPSFKKTMLQNQSTPRINPVQPIVKPLPAPITLQGYVKRSDGPNTVWINHKPTEENAIIDDVQIGRLSERSSKKNDSLLVSQQRLQKTDQLMIKIPANGKIVQLKAGQRYEPEDNQIKEITTLARENKLQLEQSESSLEQVVQ